jgi:hypothetical protein
MIAEGEAVRQGDQNRAASDNASTLPSLGSLGNVRITIGDFAARRNDLD